MYYCKVVAINYRHDDRKIEPFILVYVCQEYRGSTFFVVSTSKVECRDRAWWALGADDGRTEEAVWWGNPCIGEKYIEFFWWKAIIRSQWQIRSNFSQQQQCGKILLKVVEVGHTRPNWAIHTNLSYIFVARNLHLRVNEITKGIERYQKNNYFLHWNFDEISRFAVFFHEWNG